jgi:hypothetical protein
MTRAGGQQKMKKAKKYARHMEGSLTGHEGTGAGSSALIHGMAVV